MIGDRGEPNHHDVVAVVVAGDEGGDRVDVISMTMMMMAHSH